MGEDNFALPWCLPLACTGHTFPSGVPHFIPKPTLSHATLSFPAVHAGDVGYQTISIKNDGDTPMLFQVRMRRNDDYKDDLAQVIDLEPDPDRNRNPDPSPSPSPSPSPTSRR